jgi:hypothetical protein
VSQQDERLVPAFSHSVLNVRNRLPFARLPGNEQLNVVLLKRLDLLFRARGAGKQRGPGDLHRGIAHDPHCMSPGARPEPGSNLPHGRAGQREPMRIRAALICLPSEPTHYSGENAIRLSQMPGIVQAPDYKMMFADVGELLLFYRVARERSLIIKVVVEGRFMRDDQVLGGSSRFFKNQ